MVEFCDPMLGAALPQVEGQFEVGVAKQFVQLLSVESEPLAR
jgi:hypothetical protein